MKLNDFVHKKPVSRQASTQFIIENEVKEQKYQDQINALDLELGHYKNLESERDVAVQKLEVEKDKVRTLGQENSNFEQEITSLKTTVENQESSLERIPLVEEEIKILTDEMSKINKEVRKQNKEFRDEITYWEKEAKEISVQLEQALNVENNLRTWVTKLEQEEATNKTIKSGLDKNINTMEETVSEMGSVIDGLVKENNYLRGVNRDFRKQLARPKYLSMGSIAKKEGFKMPQGKENIRTKYLGNASPTLLKFKAKGEDSNAG